MDFKDAVAADSDVFLDPGEFAETHTVTMGGLTKEVTAVLDSDLESEATVSTSDGLSYATKRFYVRDADLPRAAAVGKAISIDGTAYLVTGMTDDMGLQALTLAVYED